MKGKEEFHWHHVEGVSGEELRNAAREARRVYGEIIDLPHPTSGKHPRMAAEKRAAQFLPFAALTGYDAAIAEAGENFDIERGVYERETFTE